MKTLVAPAVAWIALWALSCCTAAPAGAATFTVANTLDSGPGSLRDAILQANANPGWDRIDFALSGVGPFTISPLGPYPQLTDNAGVMIDGLSQPGASAGANPPSTAALQVMIDGSQAGAAHGFWIVSCMNTIRGLVIGNFQQDGIRIEGMPTGTFGNTVTTCFIGTDHGGALDCGNGWNQLQLWAGVSVIVTPAAVGFAYDNVVELCLIPWNYAEGIQFSNCPPGDVYHNLAFHNFLGTDPGGWLGQGNDHYGIYIGEGARENDATDNLIADNHWGGISICGYAQIGIRTWGNQVLDNVIGLTVDRITPLPNQGNGVDVGQYGSIQEGYAPDNFVCRNLVAENHGAGVAVWEHPSSTWNSDGNCITQNAIWNNGGLGIDLNDDGVTSNDPGDMDAGANQDVNFPVILTADYFAAAGITTITGTLDLDTDPTLGRVEVFKARTDITWHGEGEVYLGQTIPDPLGNWSINVTGLAVGDSVTATSVDVASNASEFSPIGIVIQSPVGVEEALAGLDRDFRLDPARPCPFSASTEILYALPDATPARLSVHDVTGRLVRTLAEGRLGPGIGRARWNGRDDRGLRVASGVYLLRLETADRTITRKVLRVD